MTPKYRADIDGLRAIAVGGVVLYHAFKTGLPGGYIGVDIFFVISGYLITTIIANEALAGKFSILTFYERRFRRILPALGAMLLVTTIAAVIILPPGELREYGRSLVSVGAFASNVEFWWQGGYFDGPAEDKPLLHTWSLAVEEQFYIVWPLIAAALIGLGRQRLLKGFVWVAVVTSLIAAEYVVRIWPTQAFYLLPYRAWELGLGALLAVGAVPALRTAIQREVAGWLGLALMLVPMLIYTPETRFPGISALPPCLGAMLVIHAGRDATTQVGRLLSFRPILYTGLISYSFYLWHWPVLVLSHIGLNRELTFVEASAAVVAAYALAALSLRYVEAPFRRARPGSAGRTRVLITSAAGIAAFALVGLVAWRTDGLEPLASPRVMAAQKAMNSVNPYRAACHADGDKDALGPLSRCVGGARPGADRYDVMLWGDSHADHLMPGLVEAGRRDGFSVRQATVSGCAPTILSQKTVTYARKSCKALHGLALEEAAAMPTLRAVVLSARWSKSLPGFIANARRQGASDPDVAGAQRFSEDLGSVLGMIRAAVGPDVEIILVGSTPEFDIWPATCFARATQLGSDEERCARREALDARWGPMADHLLHRLAPRSNVRIADVRALFCGNANLCDTRRGDAILFRDDDHLTNYGSQLVATSVAPLLESRSRLARVNPATQEADIPQSSQLPATRRP